MDTMVRQVMARQGTIFTIVRQSKVMDGKVRQSHLSKWKVRQGTTGTIARQNKGRQALQSMARESTMHSVVREVKASKGTMGSMAMQCKAR